MSGREVTPEVTAPVMAVDVLIVGAGPAGCTAALNLAPTRRVMLIDRRADTPPRVGESLPSAAGRLLADMGLLAEFQAQGHGPCHGQRSFWGGPQPVERDGLRDPYGPGWHLDRARFEAWLRDVARRRGALLTIPADLGGLSREGEGWRVTLSGLGAGAGRADVTARLLIDAGGRLCPVARRLGLAPRAADRLACAWAHIPDNGRESGLTLIAADPDGWWYSAPLPAGRRILAFHGDADLPAVREAHDRAGLLARAAGVGMLAPLLPVPDPGGPGGFTSANSAFLPVAGGRGWLACGDAAVAFDPLSSQGLFNALYTGLAAAEAADRTLSGQDAIPDYSQHLGRVRQTYRAHLSAWYGLERRWPDRPFWARRL